jgi:hypothetical protein
MHISSKNTGVVEAPRRPPVPTSAEVTPLRPAATRGSFLWLAARVLGALSVLAVGAVHLQQNLYLYSAIPTIGTLFVLNFAGATAIGLGLLAPVEHWVGRLGDAFVALLALGGAGLAATSFVFLLIAERTPVFGFTEPGYDPPAIMASRIAELVTVALLGSFLVARLVRRAPVGRW